MKINVSNYTLWQCNIINKENINGIVISISHLRRPRFQRHTIESIHRKIFESYRIAHHRKYIRKLKFKKNIQCYWLHNFSNIHFTFFHNGSMCQTCLLLQRLTQVNFTMWLPKCDQLNDECIMPTNCLYINFILQLYHCFISNNLMKWKKTCVTTLLLLIWVMY